MNRTILPLVLLVFTVVGDSLFAAGHDKWTWSAQLPAQLKTQSKRSNRTAESVGKLFRGPPHPPSIQQVLDFLGLPEAFSPQFMYSRTHGTGGSSRAGGTLRFLLDDGSEVHVWTSDYKGVGLAVRYRKKGRSELLYK